MDLHLAFTCFVAVHLSRELIMNGWLCYVKVGDTARDLAVQDGFRRIAQLLTPVKGDTLKVYHYSYIRAE